MRNGEKKLRQKGEKKDCREMGKKENKKGKGGEGMVFITNNKIFHPKKLAHQETYYDTMLLSFSSISHMKLPYMRLHNIFTKLIF